MPAPVPSLALRCLALALFVVAFLPMDAAAQQPTTRVLSTGEEPVKLADGSETTYRYEISFDYAAGVTTRRAYDAAGSLFETVELAKQPAPTPEELAEAKAIVAEDAAISGAMARSNATVEGGFILYADQLPACAPPARCLQFDVMPPSKLASIQFVVVDLSTRTIVERDLFPDL